MVSGAEFELSSAEPITKRYPLSLAVSINELWYSHFGTYDVYYELPKAGLLSERKYASYFSQLGFYVLSLEHLAQAGMIEKDPEIFDVSGRIHRTLPQESAKKLMSDKPLKGVSVGVFGGPEGRVFAQMGADTINIAPSINLAPPLDLPNLQEISAYFDSQLAEEYKDSFDLTFTSRVFETGSGLKIARQPEEKQFKSEFSMYEEFLRLILETTKAGGISVHDGDLVRLVLGDEKVNSMVKICEVAPLYSFNTVYGANVIFVLEKVADLQNE